MQIAQRAGSAIAQQLSSQNLTIPLWGLVIFILWTIAIVTLLIVVRVRHLATGGDVKDFGVSDNNNLMWRLFRVQANLVENLPLYLGVVLLLVVKGVSGSVVDLLVSFYIVSRLFHSIVHIIGADPKLRILGLAIQFSCLISLITLAIVDSTPVLESLD